MKIQSFQACEHEEDEVANLGESLELLDQRKKDLDKFVLVDKRLAQLEDSDDDMAGVLAGADEEKDLVLPGGGKSSQGFRDVMKHDIVKENFYGQCQIDPEEVVEGMSLKEARREVLQSVENKGKSVRSITHDCEFAGLKGVHFVMLDPARGVTGSRYGIGASKRSEGISGAWRVMHQQQKKHFQRDFPVSQYTKMEDPRTQTV